MIKQNTIISEIFTHSLNNAYGSKKHFEQALIYTAYKNGNKGKLNFGLNKHLNFEIYSNQLKDNIYPLLTFDLDKYDIYNFIEEIDYHKLSANYVRYRALIESN